jgi:hypothetical protein
MYLFAKVTAPSLVCSGYKLDCIPAPNTSDLDRVLPSQRQANSSEPSCFGHLRGTHNVAERHAARYPCRKRYAISIQLGAAVPVAKQAKQRTRKCAAPNLRRCT